MKPSIRQIGKLTAYIPLLEQLRDTRHLHTLRKTMQDTGVRVALIDASTITLVNTETQQHPTPDGMFALLAEIKHHEAEEYAVTPAELAVLTQKLTNAIEASDLFLKLAEEIEQMHTPPADPPRSRRDRTAPAPEPTPTPDPIPDTPAPEPHLGTGPDAPVDIDLPPDIT